MQISVGIRKVAMGIWFSVLDLIAFLNGLPGTDYQVIMLALIAGFFGANAYENRVKPSPSVVLAPAPVLKPPDKPGA